MNTIRRHAENGKDLEKGIPEMSDPFLQGILGGGVQGSADPCRSMVTLGPSHYHPDNFAFIVSQMRPHEVQPFVNMAIPPEEVTERAVAERMMAETCMAWLLKDLRLVEPPRFSQFEDHPTSSTARPKIAF